MYVGSEAMRPREAVHPRLPCPLPPPPNLVHQVKNSTSSFRTFALIGVAAACYASTAAIPHITKPSVATAAAGARSRGVKPGVYFEKGARRREVYTTTYEVLQDSNV